MKKKLKTRFTGAAALCVLFAGYLLLSALMSGWELAFKIMGVVSLLGVGAWLLMRYFEESDIF